MCSFAAVGAGAPPPAAAGPPSTAADPPSTAGVPASSPAGAGLPGSAPSGCGLAADGDSLPVPGAPEPPVSVAGAEPAIPSSLAGSAPGPRAALAVALVWGAAGAGGAFGAGSVSRPGDGAGNRAGGMRPGGVRIPPSALPVSAGGRTAAGPTGRPASPAATPPSRAGATWAGISSAWGGTAGFSDGAGTVGVVTRSAGRGSTPPPLGGTGLPGRMAAGMDITAGGGRSGARSRAARRAVACMPPPAPGRRHAAAGPTPGAARRAGPWRLTSLSTAGRALSRVFSVPNEVSDRAGLHGPPLRAMLPGRRHHAVAACKSASMTSSHRRFPGICSGRRPEISPSLEVGVCAQ